MRVPMLFSPSYLSKEEQKKFDKEVKSHMKQTLLSFVPSKRSLLDAVHLAATGYLGKRLLKAERHADNNNAKFSQGLSNSKQYFENQLDTFKTGYHKDLNTTHGDINALRQLINPWSYDDSDDEPERTGSR